MPPDPASAPARRDRTRIVAVALFALVALLTIAHTVDAPLRNWDLIPYLAAARSIEDPDPVSVHAHVYEHLRTYLGDSRYGVLTDDGEGGYRSTVAADPASLAEIVRFYRVRVAYVGAIHLLGEVGVRAWVATWVVSLLSVVLAYVVLAQMSLRHLSPTIACAVPALIVVTGIPAFAAYSTPDGMAILTVAGLASLFLDRRWMAVLVLVPLSVCVRTDLLLLAAPLGAAVAVAAPRFRIGAIASIAVTVAATFALNRATGYPGWETIFHFTLIEKTPYPISQPPEVGLATYLKVLAGGLFRIPLDPGLALFVAILAVGGVQIVRRAPDDRRRALRSPPVLLLAAGAAFVLLHFAAFPVLWARFFAATYVVSGIAVGALLRPIRPDATGMPRATRP